LGRLNRSAEAIQVYDELLRRFGDATEPALREPIANALVGKGRALYTLGRSEESELAFQEVLQRFADSPDAVAQQAVEVANAPVTPIAELILNPPDPGSPSPHPK
jgi:tetratricopeptide (TPR) repeat protein